MKIIFLENVVNYGGAKIATVNLAYQLRRYTSDKFETMIIDVNGSCQPFVEACRKHNIMLRIASPGEKPTILKGSGKMQTLFNRISFFPEYLRNKSIIHKLLKDADPDWIFVNTERALSYLSGYKKGRAKVMFYAHYWYLNSQITKSNRYYFKKLTDRFLCVSDATRQALYNNGIADIKDIYVAHNSIDEGLTNVEPAYIPDSDGCLKILLCGGFTEIKGQHIAVEIARKLKEKGIRFMMIFTGIIYAGGVSQRYYEKIVNKVKEYDLQKQIVFVVGHSNVYDYIRASDILIVPSSTEGFPLVIMEAQIMHKPVIANGVGGIIDLIHDGYTGFIANYNNVDDYVEKIVSLQDTSLYQFIEENAYNFASHSLTVEAQIRSIINAMK